MLKVLATVNFRRFGTAALGALLVLKTFYADLQVAFGAGLAIDVIAQTGFPPPRPSHGESVIFDYDGDNYKDILLSSHGQEWPLLRQGPPSLFSQVMSGTFAGGLDRHGCFTADFNNDGRPDLYCVRGACGGLCLTAKRNELYLQRSDRSYEKILGAWGAEDPHGRGRGALATDIDGDKDIDLIVVNERSTQFPNVGNHFYRNTGGRFVEVINTPLRHSIGTEKIVALPKPSGLYPDVVMDTADGIIYYKNVRGIFSSGVKISGGGPHDVDVADLNGDGMSDLVVVRSYELVVRLNSGNYGFAQVSYRRTLSRGHDVALCNLDGRPGIDIYVVQGKRPENQHLVLLNNGSGDSFESLPTPFVATGYGDIGTCLPSFPGALGGAVLVTNNFEVHRGPNRLIILKLVVPSDFDPELYVSLHPDLVAAKVDGTAHYLRYGYFERRRYK